jgi:hypothetical protein
MAKAASFFQAGGEPLDPLRRRAVPESVHRDEWKGAVVGETNTRVRELGESCPAKIGRNPTHGPRVSTFGLVGATLDGRRAHVDSETANRRGRDGISLRSSSNSIRIYNSGIG